MTQMSFDLSFDMSLDCHVSDMHMARHRQGIYSSIVVKLCGQVWISLCKCVGECGQVND